MDDKVCLKQDVWITTHPKTGEVSQLFLIYQLDQNQKKMRYLITSIFLLFVCVLLGQKDELIIVEPFAIDSISIDNDLMLMDEVIHIKGWHSTHNVNEKKYQIALDSALILNANVRKITDIEHLEVQLYRVGKVEYDKIKIDFERVKEQHDRRYEELSWFYKLSADKKDNCWYKENRFKSWYSIPRDSTTGKYLEVGFSGGMDILFALNLHANVELNMLNTSLAKISFSNKAGVMSVPIGEYWITYYSPGIKLSVPIKNVWLTATYGKEYLKYHVQREGYTGSETDVIDTRIDIGLKFYKSKNTSIEFYYPLRLDREVIPWWTGGIVASMNYRL